MSLRSEVIRIVNELLGNSRKISELPAASALTGTEQVELNQGGASVRTTTQDIADLGSGGGGSQDLQDVLTTGSVLTTSNLIDTPGGEEFRIQSENAVADSSMTLNGVAGNAEFSATDLVNLAVFDGTNAANILLRPTFINLIGLSAGLQINNAAGTAGQVITSNGPSAAPTWQTPPPKVIQLAASDETSALTTGTAKITFRVPYAMTLTAVRASLTVPQYSGNILTVDINNSGSSILSTKITIDNMEETSVTAVTPPVISAAALADDTEITIDIDQIGDGSAKGLKITLIGV